MSNTQTWPDPDTVFKEIVPGQNVGGVYLLDPVTRQPISPATGSGAGGGLSTNDGTFAKETGGNLANIKTYTSAFADSAATTGTVTNDGDVVSIALPGGQATVLANILLGTLIGTLLFEASPDSGTTWVSVNGSQSGASTIGTSTTTAGVWRVGVAGFTNFRIRLHPTTSGTSGTITLRATQGVHNVAILNASPLGQQTKAASAPVVLPSDQIVPVNGGYVDLSTTVTGLANGATVVGPIDVSGYTWGAFQATGTYSMTLSFQCSMNGTTWANIPWDSIASTTVQAPSASYGAAGTIYNGPLPSRYFQLVVSGYTSNTSLNAYCRVFANPPAQLPAQLPVTVTPTTIGGTTDFHRISTADTNAAVVKAGTGQVYAYDIGNSGASDVWVKLYNKASAPTVGTDATFRTIYVPKGSSKTYHNAYGIPFGTGIAIAITGGAADADATAIAAAQVVVELDFK